MSRELPLGSGYRSWCCSSLQHSLGSQGRQQQATRGWAGVATRSGPSTSGAAGTGLAARTSLAAADIASVGTITAAPYY